MEARAAVMHNGIMVYWKEVPNAARYLVNLSIFYHINKYNDKTYPLCQMEKERNVFYHSFTLLSPNIGGMYCVQVLAEGRDGKVVDKSDAVFVEPAHLRS